MNDDILDLGQGELLITDLENVDLSGLEARIIECEQSGVQEIEIETTK